MKDNHVQNGTVFYRLPQLSEKLGIEIPTLRRYAKEGRLKAKKIGKSWYVLDANLREFLSPDKGATQESIR